MSIVPLKLLFRHLKGIRAKGRWVTLEAVTGNSLIIILVVADLAVCAVVLVYFFWGRRQEQRPADMASLRKLIDSLRALVKESDRASKDLLDALNERHRRTEELFRQMDTREKRMAGAIREAERIEIELEHSDRTRMYGEVSRLAERGLSEDEIARRVKLPRGEIELILGLKR